MHIEQQDLFPHLLSSNEILKQHPFKVKGWRTNKRIQILEKYNGNLTPLLYNFKPHCGDDNRESYMRHNASIHIYLINQELNIRIKSCYIKRIDDKYATLYFLYKISPQLSQWAMMHNIINLLFGDEKKYNYFFSPCTQTINW